MTTLFISDLHLEDKRPDTIRAFLHFLAEDASRAEALYILGDLFEAWVGDDDDAPLAGEVRGALRRLSNNGTRVYFMHGNRDFLVGEDFARDSGCQLLSDPSVVDLYGSPTLLMHGDSLCTGDADYMQLRAQVRSRPWQQQILAQPLEARRQLAQQLRMASAEANSNKAEDIMDVTPSEVNKALREHGCARLIHGHTHRPAVHKLDVDGEPAERIVLGDWDSHLWVLRVDSRGYSLDKRPI